MLTWGETSNATMAELGVAPDRLVAVGSPRHDQMRARDDVQARAELCRSLDLPEQTTLVFFSNGNDLVRNGMAPEECAQWLGAAAVEERQMNIVVRLHPNEDGALYRGLEGLKVTKGVPDVITTLSGCDVAASLCSTVLYEALLFDKPVWQLYAEGWPSLADNWSDGLAARVASSNQLVDMIREHLADRPVGRPESATVARVFAHHGEAARRVVTEVSRRALEAIPS